MRKFSLSRAPETAWPDSVRAADGREFSIDADFRTVLKCLRVFKEPDLRPGEKVYLLLRWFFNGETVPGASGLFLDFVLGGKACDGGDGARDMDFEQDADAIYASFLTAYGLDLTEIPFLHWYKFLALLGTLTEDAPLMRRIALRKLDTSKLRGKDRQRAEQAKQAVRLKAESMSEAEAALQRELDAAMAEGRDPADILQRISAFYGGEDDGE